MLHPSTQDMNMQALSKLKVTGQQPVQPPQLESIMVRDQLWARTR